MAVPHPPEHNEVYSQQYEGDGDVNRLPCEDRVKEMGVDCD